MVRLQVFYLFFQVELYNTGRALRKIKRHPDSVDVGKADWKGINTKSDEMEKPKIKTEYRSINQSDDMEIETRSSKKDGSSLGDNKPNIFVGGPSSW